MSKPGDRVQELWAYLAIDDNDIEGIVSAHSAALGNVPMIGADAERMRSLRPIAEETARLSGAKIQLVRFSGREVIEELDA